MSRGQLETIAVDVGALVAVPDVGPTGGPSAAVCKPAPRAVKTRRPKFWSWHVGPYRCRVRVFATASGMLYAELRTGQAAKRQSLKHRDRERAKAWAREEQARLALGLSTITDTVPTVARVLGAYMAHQSPRRRAKTQKDDQRAQALWTAVLGADKDLTKLTRREWLEVTDRRASGALDARGQPVPDGVDAHGRPKRRPVRARAVAADLEWLRGVLRWATAWQDTEGRYLLRENPARGLPIPAEPNPQRPVATADRYEAIRRVSDRVVMEIRTGGKRHQVRSYLSEILDLVNATGRRVSAVLQLRYEDLRLAEPPHGGIRWPADTDKMGKDWWAPITAAARAALDRVLAERPGIGRAYLFPSPRNRERPVSKDLASAWLEAAERLADVPKQRGSLWHAYRRKWATERKHLPDRDVAAAGGWSDLSSLKTAYQQVDQATLVRVVLDAAELREAQA